MPCELFLPEAVRDVHWFFRILSHVFWCLSPLCQDLYTCDTSVTVTQSKLTHSGQWPKPLALCSHQLELISHRPAQGRIVVLLSLLFLRVEGVVDGAEVGQLAFCAPPPHPPKQSPQSGQVSWQGTSRDSVSLIGPGISTALMNWLMLTKVTICIHIPSARNTGDKIAWMSLVVCTASPTGFKKIVS